MTLGQYQVRDLWRSYITPGVTASAKNILPGLHQYGSQTQAPVATL
jgi:hypothetical protein